MRINMSAHLCEIEFVSPAQMWTTHVHKVNLGQNVSKRFLRVYGVCRTHAQYNQTVVIIKQCFLSTTNVITFKDSLCFLV